MKPPIKFKPQPGNEGAVALDGPELPPPAPAGEEIARLVPQNDWVLLELFEANKIRPSGLILPNGAQGEARRGRIIATGPGIYNNQGAFVPMTLKVGDEVLLPGSFGVELSFEGERCFLMRANEVLCVVKPKA